MKNKLLLLAVLATSSWFIYSGFSPQDDGPRWNQSPSSRINSGTVIQEYSVLPQVDISTPVINEPDYIQTQQGVFVVNSPFRVHPTTAGHQTEVPITIHPANPLIMYGSANTSRGGNFSTGWYVTTDGGTTWYGNDTMLTTAATPVFNFGDPGPVIDRTGRFIVSYITLTGQMGSSFSTNNGYNWSSTTTFPGSSTSSDKNFSSTDDATGSANYLRSYTYYTEFASGVNLNRIVGTYTTNQGVSWTNIAAVSPPVSPSHFHQGADTKVGPNGEVYVVWANGLTSDANFKEDSLGFAKSTNGGVSWVISKNNVANVNGNRTFNMMNGIRVAGFPRIDVDRTCGARAGWIYVCMGEKNPGIAGDISDITLYKSTDGGTTWSTGVRVNQDAFGNGRKQYMGAIRVDESGGVNVVYYDTRNTPTGDSAEVYLSRSTDGGVTFTDLKVGNKFRHAPTGVPGVNTQYAGDYIGVTSALIAGNSVNGNQRIWPYWTANNFGVYNAWTAKVELIPSNPCPGCQDFSATAFTPDYYALEYTGTQYWTRQTPSAFAAGTGSAKFDFWNASSGISQSISTNFEPVGTGYYLTFDRSYSPWSSGIDSLIIETSTNGGNTYSNLSRMFGDNSGNGTLNTVGIINDYSPTTGGQWASNIFALPAGTNKVRFKAVSGFGNNLYIDNICIQALATPVSGFIGVTPQGFYRGTPSIFSGIPDTVKIYLHRTDFSNVKVDSSILMIDAGTAAAPTFTKAITGGYYIEVNHRNSLETWSKSGGQFYVRGNIFLFDFLEVNNAYDNNQYQVNVFNNLWGMYSGDLDQDGTIDATDLSGVENAATNSLSGYIIEDVNGDDFADGSDVSIVENNVGVTIASPPGAEPTIQQYELDQNPVFLSDAVRQKYESGKQALKENQQKLLDIQNAKIRKTEELKSKYNFDQKKKEYDKSIDNSKSSSRSGNSVR